MEIQDNKGFFESIECSIYFDIVRFVSIFLIFFGHNLGTAERLCFANDRPWEP